MTGSPKDWTEHVAKTRLRKVPVTIRVDPDVLNFFRAFGEGYQTWMNNVLRAYMAAQQREEP
jgi:uncharacterized protein (DUF4415 family)